MPVNSLHPDYQKMLPRWKRMRDVTEGQDAIHRGAELYLPRLTGEEDADYLARIARTPFFEATWRTIEGLRGMLFRKPPVFKVAAGTEAMLTDVTKSGVSLAAFALKVGEEALTLGRVGVMVDYPPAPKDEQGRARVVSVADVERMGLRPHLALYTAESIINWKTEWRGNRTMLTRVVLAEKVEVPDPKDRFVSNKEDRWRVLELNNSGHYTVTVYKLGPQGAETIESGPDTPLMKGKPLGEIPFRFIGTDDTTPAVDMPPLLGLANLNIAHFQTNADRKLGAHRTALPTPYIAGNVTQQLGPNGQPVPVVLHMGGSSAWFLPGSDITVGMLEYQGAGLNTLAEDMEREERQMAVLGARMLEQQKSGVEAAETAGIHRSGENSALAAIGATISEGLRWVLEVFDQWAGGAGGVEFRLNDEFFPVVMSAQEVAELVKGWQAGAFSEAEMFERMQKGGWIRDDKDLETHQTEIATNPPALAAPPIAGDADE